MKAFSDLEQSKKLAKILPLESADMSYRPYREEGGIPDYESDLCPYRFASWCGFPCWSLAALLDVLPQSVRLVGTPKDSYWYCECVDSNNQRYAGLGSADNPIDACYEMIILLHTKHLL